MKPLSLILTPDQTAELSDNGESFIVVHRTMDTTRPDINRRWALTLVPCSITQANAAVGTITGTHRAVRITTKKP